MPKNSLSGQGQFGPNLVQNYATLSHDSLSEDLFEVSWHDEALDKSSPSHFSKKKFLFGQYGPIWLKITQPTALEVFRNILA